MIAVRNMRRLLFPILLYAAASHASKDIYIVEGSMASPELGRPIVNPLVSRSLWDRLASIGKFTLPDIYYSTGFDEIDVKNLRLVEISFTKVNAVWKRLKEKGYTIHLRKKIEVDDLFKILTDDSTVAVFHIGHGITERESPNAKPKEAYLSVYHNNFPVPLTPELIAEEKTSLKTKYKVGKNLRLFFTGACFGGYCETDLRTALEFPPQVEYIAAGGLETSSIKIVAQSFLDQISQWAETLPRVDEVPESERCEIPVAGLLSD
jgi:hypothetical protein